MKITIDYENKNIPKKSFEVILQVFDCLFKDTPIEFINYKLVDDTIEDFAQTQFFLKSQLEQFKEI